MVKCLTYDVHFDITEGKRLRKYKYLVIYNDIVLLLGFMQNAENCFITCLERTETGSVIRRCRR